MQKMTKIVSIILLIGITAVAAPMVLSGCGGSMTKEWPMQRKEEEGKDKATDSKKKADDVKKAREENLRTAENPNEKTEKRVKAIEEIGNHVSASDEDRVKNLTYLEEILKKEKDLGEKGNKAVLEATLNAITSVLKQRKEKEEEGKRALIEAVRSLQRLIESVKRDGERDKNTTVVDKAKETLETIASFLEKKS